MRHRQRHQTRGKHGSLARGSKAARAASATCCSSVHFRPFAFAIVHSTTFLNMDRLAVLSKHFAADEGEQLGDAPNDAWPTACSSFLGKLHDVAKICTFFQRAPPKAPLGSAAVWHGSQPQRRPAMGTLTSSSRRRPWPPSRRRCTTCWTLDGLLSAKERQTRAAVRDFMVGGYMLCRRHGSTFAVDEYGSGARR